MVICMVCFHMLYITTDMIISYNAFGHEIDNIVFDLRKINTLILHSLNANLTGGLDRW